jgi:hypothetical protein
MSYDVDAGIDSHNYTSNMRQFFVDFGVYPPSWNGKDRNVVADEIDGALASIEANRLETLKAEYNAPNGWGDVETAIKFLRSVRNSCRREIPQTVHVS